MQPQYPPAQYPPQPYPPQYPVAPAYPQQYPVQPQYAPPPPPPPMAPAAQGSLTEFFGAPSTASKAWVFKDKPIGTTYSGIVARAVASSDVRQQTDQGGRPQTYRDGRPKWVMVVPMLVAPSAEFPEGQASWWVKGQARDELVRAMAEAGAPEGPPEQGAGITVQLIGQRPVPGMNPAFQYRVQYLRPGGAVAQTASAPAVVGQWTPEPAPQVPPPVPVQQPVYAPAPAAPAPVFIPPQPVPAAAPAGQVAAQLTPDQQALLAKLTGAQG